MIRSAVIGSGNIGNIHAGVYKSHARSKLVAICDLDRARADAMAERFDVPAYYSVEALVNNVELDAAGVATAGVENGSHHFEPVMQLLEAGKHVLCEKPISNDINEARKMVARADELGLCLGVNLNHRFVPPAAKAHRWIHSGCLGDLLLINMTMWIDNPNDSTPWFHLRALHPHSLDVMRYFCGDVKRVHTFAGKAPGRDCWSNVQINLEFESGVVGHLTGSYDGNQRHNLECCEVLGTKGRFVLDNLYEELTFYPRDSDELSVTRNSIMGGLSGFQGTFENRIGRWIEQLADRAAPAEIEASGHDGLAVQEIIEAAILSHASGEVIEVSKRAAIA